MKTYAGWLITTVFSLFIILSCGGEDTSREEAPAGQVSTAALQLIILGGPGAGKGTQAEKIAEKYGLCHISTGSILRAEVAKGTPLGKRVADIMEAGELVADSIVLRLVDERLLEADCRKGFILDGFPRTIPQAEGLGEILKRRENSAVRVLLLQVSDQEMMDRLLKRGRADDTAETIGNRIAIFHEQTDPLIDYYQARGVLISVDGEQAIDSVFHSITTVLDGRK